MKLKKIEVEGFRTFKNKQVFDLSNYNDNSFVYVTGENKVEQGLGGNDIGKSSLFEALTWCLYGKTSVNLKAGNIVNWDVKTCKVTIELDNVIVSRIQFPNKILINNEVKTQEDIDKIIGIDYHGFLHSVYISQFSDKFFDLDPSDKLKVFSDIMQFNDWVDRSDKAKHKVKKIEDEIQDNSIKLSNCEGQISILNTQDYKTNSLEWESKNKREAENRQIKINNYKEEINELANKKIIAIEKRKSLGERINELKIDLEKENELLNEIKLDYENKKDKTIKLSVNVSNKQKDLTNFRKVEAICGVCYQTVKREHKSKTLATMKNAYEILSENYKESKKERDESYKIFNEQSKMRDNIKEELYAQESKEPKIRAEINNCEANIIRINKFLIELEGGLQKTKDAINPYTQLEEKRVSELKTLKSDRNYLEKIKIELKNKKTQYEYWVKGFKEIRLMVLADALNEFEICINNNLSKLGLDNWEVELDVERESKDGKTIKKGFEVMISSPYNNKHTPFKAWGGGVSQRLRIAGTIGLMDLIDSKTNKNWNIEIWDEPSQWLSTEGLEATLDLLSDRAKKKDKKLFLIDHRKLSSYGGFTDIVTIIKDKNGSKII